MSATAIHWVVLGGAFAIFWFLALQIVIPIGAETAQETGEAAQAGHDPGAPARPRLLLKVGIATAVAVVLWAILYGLILVGVLHL
jgi:predicted secreted protein